MKILAIETATEACSTAILVDEKIVSSFKLAPREHTKLLFSMMEEVLAKTNINLMDLDAIAFSRGPGAFTGLRIAAGVAQGLSLSIDKPVIAVSTLEALAMQANNNTPKLKRIIPSIDARMGEVYWAEYLFEDSDFSLISEEQVTKPKVMFDNALKEGSVVAIGTGWDAYKDTITSPNNIHLIENQYPQAEAIAKLAEKMFNEGRVVSPEDAQPIYIRNKVAEKKRKQ